MTAIELDCLWCGEPLHPDARADSKYCHVNHRVAAYRERLALKADNLRHLGTDAGELEQRRRIAALIRPHTYTRPPAIVDRPQPGAAYASPEPRPQTEPAPLDDFDRWFLTPLSIERHSS